MRMDFVLGMLLKSWRGCCFSKSSEMIFLDFLDEDKSGRTKVGTFSTEKKR